MFKGTHRRYLVRTGTPSPLRTQRPIKSAGPESNFTRHFKWTSRASYLRSRRLGGHPKSTAKCRLAVHLKCRVPERHIYGRAVWGGHPKSTEKCRPAIHLKCCVKFDSGPALLIGPCVLSGDGVPVRNVGQGGVCGGGKRKSGVFGGEGVAAQGRGAKAPRKNIGEHPTPCRARSDVGGHPRTFLVENVTGGICGGS